MDVYIRFLRSKIDEKYAMKLIETVRGVGLCHPAKLPLSRTPRPPRGPYGPVFFRPLLSFGGGHRGDALL